MASKKDFRDDPMFKKICEQRLLRVAAIDVPGVVSFSGQDTFGATPSLIRRGALFNDMFIQYLLRKVERDVPPSSMTAR